MDDFFILLYLRTGGGGGSHCPPLPCFPFSWGGRGWVVRTYMYQLSRAQSPLQSLTPAYSARAVGRISTLFSFLRKEKYIILGFFYIKCMQVASGGWCMVGCFTPTPLPPPPHLVKNQTNGRNYKKNGERKQEKKKDSICSSVFLSHLLFLSCPNSTWWPWWGREHEYTILLKSAPLL